MSEPVTAEESLAVQGAIDRHIGAQVKAIRKLNGQSGRNVYLVEIPGREVVLKVLDARKARAVGCQFAADSLLKVGVPTPRVLAADRDGRYGRGKFFDFPFVIQERVGGLAVDQWLLQLKPDQQAVRSVMRQIGQHLRRIHSVVPPDGYGLINDEGIGRFNSWSQFIQNQMVRSGKGEYVKIVDFDNLTRQGLISELNKNRLEEIFCSESKIFEYSDARLVHNDLTLKNIIINPESLNVAAFLDLHNAISGDPALDLARFKYFYRDRDYFDSLRCGYGKIDNNFHRRQTLMFVFVLLEKINWLVGREQRFPNRLGNDLEELFKYISMW